MIRNGDDEFHSESDDDQNEADFTAMPPKPSHVFRAVAHYDAVLCEA
jgi:hypothetical protein